MATRSSGVRPSRARLTFSAMCISITSSSIEGPEVATFRWSTFFSHTSRALRADDVHRATVGDCHEEGAQCPPIRVVPVGLLPQAHEDILGDVLGERPVPSDP